MNGKSVTVVSQPMYFPWAGIFEQVRLAHTFVHFDDVPFPQGRSFQSRVQIRTANGSQWLTVPVQRGSELIKDVQVDNTQRWREKHLKTLQASYARTPYFDDMMELAGGVLGLETDSLSEINIRALEAVSRYFGFGTKFVRSSELSASGASSEKLFNIVRELGGNCYVTGHGAFNYLDHALFNDNGIDVEYMQYQRKPYTQPYPDFDPHVSILDLIANCGKSGAEVICSNSIDWRTFAANKEPVLTAA